jgi:hypothetical protein
MQVVLAVARGCLLLEAAAAPPVLRVLLKQLPLIAPRVARLRCTAHVVRASPLSHTPSLSLSLCTRLAAVLSLAFLSLSFSRSLKHTISLSLPVHQAAAVLSLAFLRQRHSATGGAARHVSPEATLAHVLSPALAGSRPDGAGAELLACLVEVYLAATPTSQVTRSQLLYARTPVRSEKKARPRLTLGIRLIVTFLIRLSV